MPENRALSQWEIDALLNQIPGATGGPDIAAAGGPSPLPDRTFSRAIKTYDFRRPDKFSKEQWTTLQAMHEQFARMIGAAFSSRLRTIVTVRLSSIDQGLYEEWQSQVPSQTVCYVLSMRPLSGNMVVEFNTDVAGEVVDRLLGGTGVLIDRGREAGEVEMGLLRTFGRTITHTLQEMWAQVQPVDPQVQDIGEDASLIQVAAPTDVVLTMFFEVNIGNHLGAMSVCIPYTVLEPVVSHLSAQVWISSGRRVQVTEEDRHRMAALIGRSTVDLQVRLGGVDVPARTIVDMREGDTFVLEDRVGRPLDVQIGDRTRFRGLPGVLGSHLALQIAEVVEEQAPVASRGRSNVRAGEPLQPLPLDPPIDLARESSPPAAAEEAVHDQP
ncbi:MAG: flagellar motor switch protein FliM [Dehalococcoidia bacterium]